MQVVVIGSGIAGITFAEKFRALNQDAGLTVLTWENDGYYSRPLLSRGFSKDTIEQTIVLKPFDTMRANGIRILSGAEVTRIYPDQRRIELSGAKDTSALDYDYLILAQGSEAFVPPPFRPFEELFHSLNSLADLKNLRKYRQSFLEQGRKPHWAIVGGGLIGCEVASDLAVSGDPVTVYHAMDRLMERQLVPEDSELLLKVLSDSGVNVLLKQNVKGFARSGDRLAVQTDVSTEFDGLIVACGFKPRTELAAEAGLECARGIKVDSNLKTSDERIYAVGDVAELPNGKVYAYILPIRSQANWLAGFLASKEAPGWNPPDFTTKAKVHGFEATHPYQL